VAINGLDHINISTAKLAETTAFFVDVLGFEVGWRPDFSFGGAWLYAAGLALVHLVEVADAPQPSRGSALDHFAFAIDDFDATLARVAASGVRHRAQAVEGTDIRQIFITDLNGVTIELNCRR
jgi:catechol 2,3-dioxygenase-like lactoylglutathione lyase family enzyme